MRASGTSPVPTSAPQATPNTGGSSCIYRRFPVFRGQEASPSEAECSRANSSIVRARSRSTLDCYGAHNEPPFEVRRLARTLRNWFDAIVAWHDARVSNGPTEGMNNLLKRVKRVAFGFTNFENFRIRALLYAGKPNVRVLDSIVVT